MSDTETLAEIRDILSRADLHRNREKNEVLAQLRELLDVPEHPEPDPNAVADDLGEKDASNDSGGTWDDDLDEKSRAELNAIAKDAGLDFKGKQADLIERIREHRAANPPKAPETEDDPQGDDSAEGTDDASDAPEGATEDGADDPEEPEGESEDTERPGPRIADED